MTNAIGLETYIVLTKVVTLLAGGFVTLLAGRAYLRTASPALRALVVGLGLVTAGGLLGGAVHQLAGLGIVGGVAIQSTFTAAGFLVLAYSLYARHADDDRTGTASPT
ncbi:hypothetical protein BRD00_10635 [Halobacteriales archaeon QS_8_69_26]|nr:MAG: hypothetical protein BRD00_10635 [Halobacteriales archaeon QS_8_69_26]